MKKLSLFDTLFKDKKGEVVIFQSPNVSLMAAGFFYLLGLAGVELLTQISRVGVFVTLGYWSILELLSGCSLFRKCLGAAVLFWLLKSWLMQSSYLFFPRWH